MNTRKTRIEDRLRAQLAPLHLEVVDESYMHSSGAGAQSHFKVLVVAERFEGLALIARQRLVNEALAEELRAGMHALAMKTMTPAQWQASGGGGGSRLAAVPRRGEGQLGPTWPARA